MAKVNSESLSNVQFSVPKKSGMGLKPRCERKPCAEISFKDFLDFLRTAYQINECIEGKEVDVDWQDVATNHLVASLLGVDENEIKKAAEEITTLKQDVQITKEEADLIANCVSQSQPAEKSASGSFEKSSKCDSLSNVAACLKLQDASKSTEHILKRKLNEVLQEGLMDSILPYVVPKQTPSIQSVPTKKSHGLEPKKNISVTSTHQTVSKDKSLNNTKRKQSTVGDIEVEIHVCDEVKNMKKDFKCPQKLLVAKMGYFAEVTTGQKLEDMDISVHCDISIFEWLMKWVKKGTTSEDIAPVLDASNVVPILVSAAFLQMDPLLLDCLDYCKVNMNEIIKTSSNLSCINDNIMMRLTNMLSNLEIEMLKDKKDKIQSRMYCKLIVSLTESSPEPGRGHFASLAHIYHCSRCDKLILRQVAGRISCCPSSMKIDQYGFVHANHTRDTSWNLNEYIRELKQKLKSWRAVYWRLWGMCHFLYCSECLNFFPVHQMQWCCYHPDMPQFFTIEHTRTTTFPIGRYPCCGERAYRFEVLKNRSGCQYKEHLAELSTERDKAVFRVFKCMQKAITEEPPQLAIPERLTRLVSSKDSAEIGKQVDCKEAQWWDGIELAPPRSRQGLLTKLWDSHIRKEELKLARKLWDDSSKTKRKLLKVVKQWKKKPEDVLPFNYYHFDYNFQSFTRSNIEATYKSQNLVKNGKSQGYQPSNTEQSVTNDCSHEVHPASDDDDDGSEDTDISEDSRDDKKKCIKDKGADKKRANHEWLENLSTRNNQDNQREFEEKAMQALTQILTKRTCGDTVFSRNSRYCYGNGLGASVWSHHLVPQGGVYQRIEEEWRAVNCPGTASAHTSRQRSVGLSARQKLRSGR